MGILRALHQSIVLISLVLNTLSDESKTVLCFGDSLTKGSHTLGRKFSPYVNRLSELYAEKDSRTVVTFQVNAAVGAEGTGQLNARLNKLLKHKKFDVIIILAGTHDLGRTLTVQEIFDSLRKMHEICWTMNIRTVGVAIPDNGYEGHGNKRRGVNSLLRSFFEQNKGKGVYLNLDELIPFKNDGELWESSINDHDKIHFSPLGYKKVGELLFETLSKSNLLKSPVL